jgi:hypothetical protein
MPLPVLLTNTHRKRNNMSYAHRITILAAALVLVAGCASVPENLVRGVEQGAQRAAQREAARAADQAVTGAVRGFENAVICAVTDQRCIDEAQRAGRPVVVRDGQGNEVRRIPAPGDDVNVNPDFVAGDSVLFFEDFSRDAVGRFPSRLEFVRGNWEIAEWQGRRLLRNTGPREAAFRIVLTDPLPEQFTIETEIYFPHANHQLVLMTQPPEANWNNVDYNFIRLGGSQGMGVEANAGTGLSSSVNPDESPHRSIVPISIDVDGNYVRTYVGQNRTSNIPNAVLPRSEAMHFENIYFASEEEPLYLGPIRVATFRVRR